MVGLARLSSRNVLSPYNNTHFISNNPRSTIYSVLRHERMQNITAFECNYNLILVPNIAFNKHWYKELKKADIQSLDQVPRSL